jgi:hypothetical protein
MSLSLTNVFSTKNWNLVIGLLTLLIVLWAVIFAVPNLFISLFYTFLGKLMLLTLIVLAGIYNVNLGVGLAIVFTILYRFSHGKTDTFIL